MCWNSGMVVVKGDVANSKIELSIRTDELKIESKKTEIKIE